MAEIIVTVEDNSLIPILKSAIELLKGVKKVAVKKQAASPDNKTVEQLPEDIKALIGIASGLTEKDIDNDERLSYLLNK